MTSNREQTVADSTEPADTVDRAFLMLAARRTARIGL
jgi:hypothetical protein